MDKVTMSYEKAFATKELIRANIDQFILKFDREFDYYPDESDEVLTLYNVIQCLERLLSQVTPEERVVYSFGRFIYDMETGLTFNLPATKSCIGTFDDMAAFTVVISQVEYDMGILHSVDLKATIKYGFDEEDDDAEGDI